MTPHCWRTATDRCRCRCTLDTPEQVNFYGALKQAVERPSSLAPSKVQPCRRTAIAAAAAAADDTALLTWRALPLPTGTTAARPRSTRGEENVDRLSQPPRAVSQKQRCASGARSAEQVSERRHSESARATSATLINYMHVHYNLISGREKEEPIVQIPKYEHSDYSVFNACVCMSTLVLFATPWQQLELAVPTMFANSKLNRQSSRTLDASRVEENTPNHPTKIPKQCSTWVDLTKTQAFLEASSVVLGSIAPATSRRERPYERPHR